MAIEIRKLSKAFDGQSVFENFSATIEENRITGIMGPSGGGKTTLLRMLMGLLPPDSGSISGLEGKRFSAVFQEDRLCENVSALSNVRLVADLPPDDIREAFAEVGIPEATGQPMRAFSGGMKRRVALVRALLAPSDVLFLDEPFKGLDEENKQRAIAYAQKKAQGKTVILVTHDRSEIESIGAALLELP